MIVGVLALQGAFREHRRAFERVGVTAREVRLPRDLADVDALVIPGGESTTMAKLMRAYDMNDAVTTFAQRGGPIWGTCAGAIAVATEIEAHPEQPRLALLDMTVNRNAYGRQVASFEADLDVNGLEGGPFRAVFIRAPRITRTGPDVNVLARYGEDPVMVASGRMVATVFHPELSGDDRIHAWFIARARQDARARSTSA